MPTTSRSRAERAEARCAAQWKAFTADEERDAASTAPARRSPELDDLAGRINDEHRAATNALRQGVLHAIAAGELLLEAKAQLKHGGWLDWLKANCEIPERTVQAYMRLARLPVEKRNAVADLPLREALSAIRSRQERLERAEEAENRPPLGPARFCYTKPDGEVLFGEAAPAAMPPTPARAAGSAEVSIKERQAQNTALDDVPSEQEAEESYQATLYEQAFLLLAEMSDETRRLFHDEYMKLYGAARV